jgi:hypothetical protein
MATTFSGGVRRGAPAVIGRDEAVADLDVRGTLRVVDLRPEA